MTPLLSRPLLGTSTDKTKLSWFEYLWFSCIVQGWVNCAHSFRTWADLMGSNWDQYELPYLDKNGYENCVEEFWYSLEEDIYEREFLESLMQMANDVATGKVETVPWSDVDFDLLNTDALEK